MATALENLRQQGCLKARFPRVAADDWTTAVTLNTAGGIAGGDRLDLRFDALAGTRVTLAAQAAERFYRALPDSAPSLVRTCVTVAQDAALEWLPQETILFDRCAMDRRLDVDLAADAWFLGMESLVFGRAAMGERVERASIRDLIRIRREGRLLLHDAVRVEGDVDSVLRRTATAADARAVATLVHVAPDAEAQLDSVRAALGPCANPEQPEIAVFAGAESGLRRGSRLQNPAPTKGNGVEASASAWNGMLIARILAPDGAALRRALIAALAVLRDARPLPRVWMC